MIRFRYRSHKEEHKTEKCQNKHLMSLKVSRVIGWIVLTSIVSINNESIIWSSIGVIRTEFRVITCRSDISTTFATSSIDISCTWIDVTDNSRNTFTCVSECSLRFYNVLDVMVLGYL